MKKLLASFAAALTISTVLTGAVYANTLSESDIQDLYDKINRLQDDILDVRTSSSASPTETEKPVAAPKVKLISPMNATVKAGASVDIDIVVKNIGTSSAENLLTQAVVSEGTAPFSLSFLNNSNSISTLSEGGSRTMSLRIKADKDAKPGVYTLTLNHSYKDINKENLTESDTIQVKIETSATSPNLVINQFDVSKTRLMAGDTFTLTAALTNLGTLEAKEVQVTVDGLDPAGILMASSADSYYYATYNKAVTNTLTYELKVAPKAKTASYPLTFKVVYKDKDGKELSGAFTYYVTVGSSGESSDKSQVRIANVKEPAGVYEVGSEFVVTMDIVNTGATEAKNVKVTGFTGEEGAIVPKSASIQVIDVLGVGESKPMTFRFAPTAKSVSQNYAVGFKVAYPTGDLNTDDTEEIMTYEQFVGVNVSNPKADEEDEEDKEDATKVSKPKIIIDSYTCDPILVKAGQQFVLTMSFENTHPTKRIENIKAMLSALETTEEKGSVFTPVDGSNTFFIDSIEPKGKSSRTMTMYTVPDAEPRTYTLVVKFEYQDSEYNVYEEEERIGINVKQVIGLETSEIVVPSDGMLGNPIYLSFTLSNTGKATLNNLKVSMEGNFDTSNTSVYFGKLDKSNSVYYDGSFIPLEPGQHPGKIIIAYEDDAGEQFSMEKEFSLNVQDAMPMDMEMMGGPMDMPEQPGMKGTLLGIVKNPWVWVGVAAAAVAVFFIIRFVRKKRKGLSLDE